jgi:hypothetical protein
MTGHFDRLSLRRIMMSAVLAATALSRPALAQTPAIQSQDSNISGIVAEITECKRQEGVLTVRLRFRNTTDKTEVVEVIRGRNYDSYYLTAASKKYFILRDTEKVPLAPAMDGSGNVRAEIAAKGAYVFWARFPAPPADVKKISYYTPLTPPFDNIPITD